MSKSISDALDSHDSQCNLDIENIQSIISTIKHISEAINDIEYSKKLKKAADELTASLSPPYLVNIGDRVTLEKDMTTFYEVIGIPEDEDKEFEVELLDTDGDELMATADQIASVWRLNSLNNDILSSMGLQLDDINTIIESVHELS